eukprot:gene9886-12128_t
MTSSFYNNNNNGSISSPSLLDSQLNNSTTITTTTTTATTTTTNTLNNSTTTSSSLQTSTSSGGSGGGGNCIRVVCRFRPFVDSIESKRNEYSIVNFHDSKSFSIRQRDGNQQQFSFDRTFNEKDDQVSVFNDVALPIVKDFLDGYHGTILAYGQTASGKTYTIYGENDSITSNGGEIFDYETPSFDNNTINQNSITNADDGSNTLDLNPKLGIIPRMIEEIFSGIVKMRDTTNAIAFVLKMSSFELYMEKVNDLYDSSKTDLRVRQHPEKGIYVENITEKVIQSPSEAFHFLNIANNNRAVAETKMSVVSSRSHSVVMIELSQQNLLDLSSKKSKLFLVDLAGSERASKTGAEGDRMKEAKNINKSLSALGTVINSLTQSSKTKTHVPYRDSKLTRVLQESLGGNSKTTLIIACSPSSYNEHETLSTIQFGVRAKKITNKPMINKEITVIELKQLLEKEKERIKELEIENSNLKIIIETQNNELMKEKENGNQRILEITNKIKEKERELLENEREREKERERQREKQLFDYDDDDDILDDDDDDFDLTNNSLNSIISQSNRTSSPATTSTTIGDNDFENLGDENKQNSKQLSLMDLQDNHTTSENQTNQFFSNHQHHISQYSKNDSIHISTSNLLSSDQSPPISPRQLSMSNSLVPNSHNEIDLMSPSESPLVPTLSRDPSFITYHQQNTLKQIDENSVDNNIGGRQNNTEQSMKFINQIHQSFSTLSSTSTTPNDSTPPTNSTSAIPPNLDSNQPSSSSSSSSSTTTTTTTTTTSTTASKPKKQKKDIQRFDTSSEDEADDFDFPFHLNSNDKNPNLIPDPNAKIVFTDDEDEDGFHHILPSPREHKNPVNVYQQQEIQKQKQHEEQNQFQSKPKQPQQQHQQPQLKKSKLSSFISTASSLLLLSIVFLVLLFIGISILDSPKRHYHNLGITDNFTPSIDELNNSIPNCKENIQVCEQFLYQVDNSYKYLYEYIQNGNSIGFKLLNLLPPVVKEFGYSEQTLSLYRTLYESEKESHQKTTHLEEQISNLKNNVGEKLNGGTSSTTTTTQECEKCETCKECQECKDCPDCTPIVQECPMCIPTECETCPVCECPTNPASQPNVIVNENSITQDKTTSENIESTTTTSTTTTETSNSETTTTTKEENTSNESTETSIKEEKQMKKDENEEDTTRISPHLDH